MTHYDRRGVGAEKFLGGENDALLEDYELESTVKVELLVSHKGEPRYAIRVTDGKGICLTIRNIDTAAGYMFEGRQALIDATYSVEALINNYLFDESAQMRIG